MKAIYTKREMEVFIEIMNVGEKEIYKARIEDFDDGIVEINGEFVFAMPEEVIVPLMEASRDVLIYLAPILEVFGESFNGDAGMVADFMKTYFKRKTGLDLNDILTDLQNIVLPAIVNLEESGFLE